MNEKQLQKYVEKLAAEFEFFAEQLWDQIDLPALARHQRQMARWLQDGPRRRGILAFRGASKTWITLAYCAWCLFRDPDARVLLVSKSEKHSKDSLFMVRRWISQVPFLQHMLPAKRAGQRDSATKFDIGTAPYDRVPSFTAASITGQITGTRASLIISDDVETMMNTLTQEMRDRLKAHVSEYENILLPPSEDKQTSIIYLGTPHSVISLYDALAEGGYAFQSWPARYPGKPWPDLDPLAQDLRDDLGEGRAKPDDPIWPDRFTDEDLSEREAAEGRSTFGMQFQMLTSLGDGMEYPLKLQDFIVMPVNRDKAPLTVAWGQTNDRGGTTRIEEITSLGFGSDGFYAPIRYDEQWAPYTSTRMWIDPSGAGADSTAYAICSYLGGNIWVHEVKGLPGGFGSETLSELARAAREFRVREVIVESNFGQSMFSSLLEPVLHRHFIEPGSEHCPDGWGCSIDSVRVSGQKEVRIIQALEPAMGSRRVILDPRVASNQVLQKQLVHLTRDRNCLKHDDEIEALAMCVKTFEDIMDVDPERAAEAQREREMEEKVRQHYAEMGLACGDAPRWFKRRP